MCYVVEICESEETRKSLTIWSLLHVYCSHVTFKMKLLTESFVAEVAREGTLFVVHQPHMSVQFVLQG